MITRLVTTTMIISWMLCPTSFASCARQNDNTSSVVNITTKHHASAFYQERKIMSQFAVVPNNSVVVTTKLRSLLYSYTQDKGIPKKRKIDFLWKLISYHQDNTVKLTLVLKSFAALNPITYTDSIIKLYSATNITKIQADVLNVLYTCLQYSRTLLRIPQQRKTILPRIKRIGEFTDYVLKSSNSIEVQKIALLMHSELKKIP